jgi:hypothetical protein
VGRDRWQNPSTSSFDLSDQIVKDEEMEGKKHVPIGLSEHASGLIVGVHRQFALSPASAGVFTETSLFRIDPELEPCFARQFHFGAQQKHGISLEVFDPPEVNNVTNSQAGGASSSSHGSDA